MSVLLDTDLLSLLERKRIPAKLAADLGSLEGTPCRSQEKKADDDVRGFVDSRYSLVSWS